MVEEEGFPRPQNAEGAIRRSSASTYFYIPVQIFCMNVSYRFERFTINFSFNRLLINDRVLRKIVFFQN